MVDLGVADVAAPPHASSVEDFDGGAGGAGEQSSSPSEVDHQSGAVDHDPADVADEGGGDGVGGVDGDAGGGLAPVPVDLARVGHRFRSAGEVGEVGFEGGVVDDDVQHRFRCGGVGGGGGGSGEDGDQGVGSALPIGAGQQRFGDEIAVGGACGVPVGVELGTDEPIEDLPQHRPLGGAAVGAEMDFGADGGDHGVAVVMGPFMIPVGPVGISQRLPPGDHHGEVGELQPHRMIDQQRFGVGELGGATPVGVDLGDHPHLIDPDLTGAEAAAEQFEIA